MQDYTIKGAPAQPSAWSRWLVLALVYCSVALLFRPVSLLEPASSGDDTSYISHALTIALDFDLNYQNEPVLAPGPGHLVTPSGNAPSNPIGPGLMAAPFVALFSIFDRIADHPVIRDHNFYPGSWSLFGFFVATVSWFFLGVWLYIDALEGIGVKINRWVILLFISAIGLPHYILLRPFMGHASEFVAIALVFWGAVRFLMSAKHGRILPELCITAGILLTLLTRFANVNIFLLPIAVWGLLFLCRDVKWPALTLRRDGLVLAGSALLALAVWTSFNVALYGVAVPDLTDTYGVMAGPEKIPSGGLIGIAQEGIRGLPLIWPLLTTSEFGLLYASPILPFGTLAIAILLVSGWKKHRFAALVVIASCALYIAIPLLVTLIWKTTGYAFRYRYFFNVLPICLLGTGLLLSVSKTWASQAIKVALLGLSAWSLVGMMFFGINPHLSSRRADNAFGNPSSFSMMGYETALAKTISTPSGWRDMAARRLPGFIAIRVTAKQDSSDVVAGTSSTARASINRIRQVPNGIFCAIMLFWLLFPLSLGILCDSVLRNRALAVLSSKR